MSNTINIGGIEVSKFYLGGSSDVKIYLGTTKLYPHLQEPCFAVVVDISQYSDRTYVDVFNEADGLWYKRNNLIQFEEYGIYGSGRTITTYDGKLTIDDGYEYEWNGSSWVNLGEVSGSTIVPQGYTEVEYIENTSTAYINTDLQIYSSTTNSFEVEAKLIANRIGTQSYQNVFSCMSEDGNPYQGFTYRYQSSSLVGTSLPNGQNTFTIVNNEDSTQTVTVTSSSSQRTYTHTYPLTLFCGLNSSRNPFRWTNSKFYYCKIKMNDELVRDLVPCKRDSDDKYGMYDIVNDVFYVSPNNVNFIGGAETGTTEYPKYYSEQSDPPNNLTFNTMAEAEAYECPWVGMNATIDGDNYIFSGDSISGYEWVYVPSRLPSAYTEIEYVENTGNSSVNLGVYLSLSEGNTFEIAMTNTITYTSGWGNYQTFLTCMSEAGEPYGGFAYRFSTSQSKLECYFKPTSGQAFSSTTVDSKYEVVISCNGIINGYTHDYPLNLFSGLNSSKSPFRYCKGRVYSLQVTLNNTLTRNFVPCQRKSDSVYGLYDLVGGVFYTSTTSTPLSGGNPV